MKRIALVTCGLVGILSTACQDHSDLFDENYANEKKKLEYAVSFEDVIGSIDPNQDWNLFTSAQVNVTINEDWGETYTVKVYTANPLNQASGALLLASGEVKSGETFTEEITVPKGQSALYIARVNNHNECLVKYAAIDNGSAEAFFGEEAGTRAAEAATRADDALASLKDIPTESEIQGMIESAIELQAGWGWNEITDGGVYKYTGDATYLNVYKQKTIIITNGAVVTANSNNCPNRVDMVIVYDGTLKISEGTNNIGNSTKLIIYPKGKVEATAEGQFGYLSANTYNAGEISGESFYYANLYNAGTIHVKNLVNMNWGDNTFENNGRVTVSEKWSSEGKATLNNCYMEVGNCPNLGNLTIADNAQLTVTGECSFASEKTVTLGEGSILQMGTMKYFYGNLKGLTSSSKNNPTVKTEKIGYFNCNPSLISGYFTLDAGDYSNANKGSETTKCPESVEACFQQSTITWASLTIVEPEEDACVGTVKYSTDEVEDTPYYVYYAFEDMGSIGDYDFNDVILRVYAPDANGDAKIQAVAAGGTLPVGVYYGDNALWSDIHESFGKSSAINVLGTKDDYIKDYPEATIHVGAGADITKLDNLYIQVTNTVGTSQKATSTLIHSGNTQGEAPQCLCIPAGWKWPQEIVCIAKAYPAFSNWSEASSTNTDWWQTVASGYDTKVVDPADFE